MKAYLHTDAMKKRKAKFILAVSLILLFNPCLIFSQATFCTGNGGKYVYNVNTRLYYNSIQEAINAPETKENHTIIVSSGVYHENIVINKSISLIGKNREETILSGNGTDPTIKVLSNNVVIKNFTLKNSKTYGIYLRSNSTSITDIIIENCHIGVVLFQSHENKISQIIARNSSIGVLLDYSTTNHIQSNVIEDCTIGVRLGACSQNNIVEKNRIELCVNAIELGNQANYNIFVSNYIKRNTNGIYFQLSKNCTFIGNVFARNMQGINIFLAASNHTFLYNSFFFNENNVKSSFNVTNIWNMEYPFGGNFWSNYNGVDKLSGVNQNKTGSDGIGDIPYILDKNNVDRYPLVGSFIKIANATVVQNKVYFIGCSANITIREINFNEKNASLTLKAIENEKPFFCKIVIPKNFFEKPIEQLNISVNEQPLSLQSISIKEVRDYVSLFFIYKYSPEQNNFSPIPATYIIGFLFAIVALFMIIIRIRTISRVEKELKKNNGNKNFINYNGCIFVFSRNRSKTPLPQTL